MSHSSIITSNGERRHNINCSLCVLLSPREPRERERERERERKANNNDIFSTRDLFASKLDHSYETFLAAFDGNVRSVPEC